MPRKAVSCTAKAGAAEHHGMNRFCGPKSGPLLDVQSSTGPKLESRSKSCRAPFAWDSQELQHGRYQKELSSRSDQLYKKYIKKTYHAILT